MSYADLKQIDFTENIYTLNIDLIISHACRILSTHVFCFAELADVFCRRCGNGDDMVHTVIYSFCTYIRYLTI